MHLSEAQAWALRPFKRHSLVLLVAGIVYVTIGVSMFTDVASGNSRTIALQFALKWWGWHGWGLVFIAAGALAIVSSRWPYLSEKWGYVVLTGLSAGWACFYLAGMWPGHAPVSNWAGVFSWGLIAFMWWAISGLSNPDVEEPPWTDT